MFHWTERRNVRSVLTTGLTGNAYLTETGEDPERYWNESIIWPFRPTRLTIDTTRLDPHRFEADEFSLADYADETGEEIDLDMTAAECLRLTGNVLYNGPVPAKAIVEVTHFAPREGWKMFPWLAEDHEYTEEDMAEFHETDCDRWRENLKQHLDQLQPGATGKPATVRI